MLIVDMPMPKDGGCHIAVDWDGHSFVCPIKRKTCDYFFSKKRPDWCPIKGELVRCSECKQYEKFDGYCKKFGMLFPKDNPCINGERKEEKK